MSNICPCCPYQAAEGKNGHVRSDSLRRHIERMHEEPDYAFVDRYGNKLETIIPKLVIKKKNDAYGNGFCFECNTWLIHPKEAASSRERLCLVRIHRCKKKQQRAPKRPKGKGDGSVAATAPTVKMNAVEKLFDKHAGDFIEHTDDIEFDLEASLKSLVKAAKTPAAPKEGSLLERLKKEKRLAPLKLDERETNMRTIYDQEEEDSDSDAEPPGTFDEIDDVILPVLIEASKSAAQRETLSNTIRDLRNELDQKEDAIELLKSSNAATVESLREQLLVLARELSEERVRRHHAEKEHPTEKSPVVRAPEPDKIELVAGNDYSQWSLPFQG